MIFEILELTMIGMIVYVQEVIGNSYEIAGQLFATQYLSISETKMVSMFWQSHSHPFSGFILRIRPEIVWGQTSQPVRRIQKHIRYHRQPSNFCPGLVLYGFCLKQILNCYQKTQKLQNRTICFKWIVELHNCAMCIEKKVTKSAKHKSKCHCNFDQVPVFLTKSPILRKLSNGSI